MVDPATIDRVVERQITLAAPSLDLLLRHGREEADVSLSVRDVITRDPLRAFQDVLAEGAAARPYRWAFGWR